ncbi:MAG: serine/threonine protein kinase, partial [Chloroflexi bacterium]|nr:serine/threonine protein kinase [Chloroflexota bacterium]
DRAGRVKVTDFGIAKSNEMTRTLAGTVLGTPAFIAPEVSAGDPVTSRADVYALGVVLFQMLTAHTPFEAENPIAIAVRSQREDPIPPSRVAPVPGWLDAIVLKALARDPGQRYPDAASLAEDLDARRAPTGAPPRAASEDQPTVRQQVNPAAVPSQAPVRRRSRWRTVAWALPLGIVCLASGLIAWAATHTPGQAGSPTAPTPAPPSNAPASGSASLENGALISNGGSPPAGWRLQTFEGTPPRWFFQPGGPSAGDHEVAISSSSGTDTAWVGTDVTARPGTRLTLSGFAKSEGIPSDGSGAAIHLVCHGADGKETGHALSPALKGSVGWQQLSASGAVPNGSTACTPQLRLGDAGKPTSGTVEFSHLSLGSDAAAALESQVAVQPSSAAAAPASPGRGKDNKKD